MSDFWHAAAGWAAQTAVAGAVVLGIGWAWLRRVEQPARRQRLAGTTVRAAVLVAVLALLPGWLKVPVPEWARPAVTALHAAPAVAPDEDDGPPAAEDAADDVAAADHHPVPVGPAPAYAAAAGPVAGGFRTTVPAGRALPMPRRADQVIDQPWDAVDVGLPPDIMPADTFLTVTQVGQELTERGEQITPAPPSAAPRDRLGEVAPLVLLPYAVIAAAGLAQLAAGQLALARMRRAAVPAPAWLQAAFDDLAFGIPFGPRLLVSGTVPGPVCFGVFRPTVLLPRKLVASASREQLRWVLAHELDHLRRGDTWTGVWVSVARAIYFFVPWFWVVRRELALSQEYLADAAAAAAGGQPVDYAAFLVDLSARPGESRPVRHPLGAAGVRAGKSDLFRRVTMLLNAKAGLERKAPRGWSVLSAGGVLTAAVLLSGVTWAADDEPKKVIVVEDKKEGDRKAEKEITVEVVVTEDEDEKKADEKKKAEKKATEIRRAGVDAKEIAALKKAVEEAAKKGDLDAVRAAVNKLEKAVAAGTPRAIVVDGKVVPVPPAPPVPGVPGIQFAPQAPGAWAWRAAGGEAVKDLEKAIEGLKKAAEQVKDQPEAKAALEKSIAEFRKKIEEAKAKGEFKVAPQAAPLVPGQFHFDWAANKERVAEELKKSLEKHAKQLEKLKDNPEALAEMKKAMDEHRKAVEQALKGLEGGEGVWRIAPQVFQGEGRVAPAAGARGVRLGVVPEPVPAALSEQLDLPKGQGVLLVEVIKGTPAEKAGFKTNDILMTIGGKEVGGDGSLSKVLAGLKSSDAIDAVVIRKGKKVTIKNVKLAEPEKAEPKAVEVKPARPAKPAPPAKPTRPARPGEESDSGKEKKSKFNSTTIRVDENEFSIRATSDETRYTITGRMEDGKPVPSSIAIRGSDNKTQEYSSLEKVPAEHRAAVKQLLGNIGGTR